MRHILLVAVATSLIAAGPTWAKPVRLHQSLSKGSNQTTVGAQIVARDAAGRASKVMVDGQVYVVCSSSVTDSCINPRQAGLDFGNQPLDHWPGHPASEAD